MVSDGARRFVLARAHDKPMQALLGVAGSSNSRPSRKRCSSIVFLGLSAFSAVLFLLANSLFPYIHPSGSVLFRRRHRVVRTTVACAVPLYLSYVPCSKSAVVTSSVVGGVGLCDRGLSSLCSTSFHEQPRATVAFLSPHRLPISRIKSTMQNFVAACSHSRCFATIVGVVVAAAVVTSLSYVDAPCFFCVRSGINFFASVDASMRLGICSFNAINGHRRSLKLADARSTGRLRPPLQCR